METVREKRVLRLEKHRTIADQKKEYCGCRCHWKSIDDFMEIPDSKLIELAEIMDRLDPSYAEDLRERKKNRPPCTCEH